MRFILTSLLLATVHLVCGQNVESFGVFGGLNIPFTLDQGLRKDPRFFEKITIKGTPVGFYYGYDKTGYGFAMTPSFVRLGQNYIVKNTTGGEVGFREINMNYFTVPLALKIHINDLSFFRLSLVASVAPSFLINGKETVTHDASKLKYPSSVSVPTDPGYVQSYDGVFVPDINKMEYIAKDKFSPFQLFAAVGFRSDFDLNDDWSLNFDGRANFGIFDPRKTDYINQLKTPSGAPDINGNPGAPDLFGARRDVFLSGEIGICRIIQTKESFRVKHSGKPITQQAPKPKGKKKPKG